MTTRRDFIKTAQKVLAQYDAARQSVKWDRRGVTLHLARPPIQRKAIA